MEEKSYSFVEGTSSTGLRYVTKKESELTEADNNLFLGNLIYEFNNCPDRVKVMFLKQVYDGAHNPG